MKTIHRVGIMIVIFVVVIMFGGSAVSYFVSGMVMLLSLILLAENVPLLKHLMIRMNKMFDVLFFIAAIWAKIYLTVTFGMIIMFAAIGYSLLYAPYLDYVRDFNRSKKFNK